jgi:hypothetical protein
MKRKLAIVILLAVLVLLSIPTVAVFFVKWPYCHDYSDEREYRSDRVDLFTREQRRLEKTEKAEKAPRCPKIDAARRDKEETRRQSPQSPLSPPRESPRDGDEDPRSRRAQFRPDRPRPIMTRGGPCEYRHIGILTVDGTEGPVSLFGRPTYRGSDRWNYYALSNQHVPQKLPVFCSSGANGANGPIDPSGPAGPIGASGQLDCAKLKGCPEASDGDTLDVRGYGRASVTLYARDEYF